MDKTIAVAIDGPSGAGKSTMARAVARQLGYCYVDTGAIYRAVGYYMRLMGIGPRDTDGVTRLLDEVNLEIEYTPDGVQHMVLNGTDVTGELRTPEMSHYASCVSAIPAVREYLLEMQRKLARERSVVMDGRDIGTVVLPEAEVKIFLTASSEERARRRYEELTARGEKTTPEEVLNDLRVRDERDSNRAAAPLKQAPDAVRLDTTGFTVEQSAEKILEIVRKRLAKREAR